MEMNEHKWGDMFVCVESGYQLQVQWLLCFEVDMSGASGDLYVVGWTVVINWAGVVGAETPTVRSASSGTPVLLQVAKA